METRNITLTLENAKELYNSDNNVLKEIALKAFTEDELTTKYTDIKIFEDACKVLKLDLNKVYSDLDYISEIEENLRLHLISIYKLDIIRKALNGADWNPKLTEGDLFYSNIQFYSKSDEIPTNKKVLGKIFADEQEYFVVGGFSDYGDYKGLINFQHDEGYGFSNVNLGLLCCKSRAIAEYMSRQFGKLIFNACYSQYKDSYRWIFYNLS